MTTCPDTEQVVTHDKCVLSRRRAHLYLPTQFRFLWSIITCFISGTDTHHTQSITSKAFFWIWRKRVQNPIVQSKALWASRTGCPERGGCISELLPVYMEFAFLIIITKHDNVVVLYRSRKTEKAGGGQRGQSKWTSLHILHVFSSHLWHIEQIQTSYFSEKLVWCWFDRLQVRETIPNHSMT